MRSPVPRGLPGADQDQFVELPSGTRICYRVDGPPDGPAVLLVSGLAEDITSWSPAFVAGLVGRGMRVIRMDNRDCGRSSYATTPPPGLLRQLTGRPRSDAYTLRDMASDCDGLLDHLGVGSAHVIGRSMGGMIAQTLASSWPNRVRTLTSIYSTTGSKDVGQPALSTLLLLASPPPRSRSGAVRAHLRITRHLAGTGHRPDDDAETAHAESTWDRSVGDQSAGSARQIQAIQASGDRTDQLRTITVPTLVIHGDRDLLVAPTGGKATAAAIPGARLVVVPGMGHHLPDSLVEEIIREITDHIASVR
ncbi:alpha/beta fold hydrolase [Streptomyces litmocidini]|uniref:Alpha/beta fold hydrolase n=1 Tax=Streptomyces litmocidini TaxID=67318 RepID=A0ABW7UIT1_9ACTN